MSVASKLRLRAKYHRRRARQLSAEAGATARMWSGSMTKSKAGAIGRLLADAYVHSDWADEYEHGITSGWADRADAMLREAMDEVAP